MDRFKFSAIAHRSHLYMSPVSRAKLHGVFDVIPLKAGDRVVDFGCGNAEMLIQLIERFDVQGIGVESSPLIAEAARSNALGRVPDASLTLHEASVAALGTDIAPCDLLLAVGASNFFADAQGLSATLERLRAFVRPGGYLLLGEGYWQCPPAPAYLALLGATPDDMRDHAGNVFAGEQSGWIPVHAVTSDPQEWDEYEWRYSRSIELYAREHPADPDNEPMLNRIRQWREGYLRYGRDTLGFGLYLFLNP